MKKSKLIFLLFPLLLTSCGGGKPSSGYESTPSGSSITPQSNVPIDDLDEYDEWLNSWSQPDHLYFNYNRGDKGGYENYCLWL